MPAVKIRVSFGALKKKQKKKKKIDSWFKMINTQVKVSNYRKLLYIIYKKKEKKMLADS